MGWLRFLPEILPFKIRGKGLAVAALMNKFLSFILIAAYPAILESFGDGPFYLALALISMAGYFFIKYHIQETSNIRLESIGIAGTDPKSEGNEVAVEDEEITFPIEDPYIH